MKTQYIIVPAVILAILIAFSPVEVGAQDDWLEPIQTRYVTNYGDFTNGTITNGTVRVMQGGRYNYNWSFEVPDCDLVIAYAHWHKWDDCYGTPTARHRDGDGFEYTQTIWPTQPQSNDNIWGAFCSGYSPGHGNNHYYWRIYPTAGTNWLNLTGCPGSEPNVVNNKWVVLVMTDCTDVDDRTHEGQWWHNWGLWPVDVGTPQSSNFYNANNDAADYTLWTVQSHYDNRTYLYFNGGLVGVAVGQPTWTYYVMMHVSKALGTGTNWVTWDHLPPDGSGYMYTQMATLAEEVPGPDIWDPVDPEFTPETPRPGEDFTVNATVENKGGRNTAATFKVSLYINSILHDEETIAGLNAGESETVTFDPVNLPYGCYNFTLVKDPDYNITDELPANRGDNIHTVFYQVGNVIVVRSVSDFDDLVDDELATKVGDTYYIQDLTITNCAGIGILIQDTTVPFVIKNCNVNDCGSKETDGDNHGMHLNHLRAGTKEIMGCTVNNNRGKGIQVMNSTYVDITGSHIQNNSAYGIDVYPRGLPGNHDDCRYVNITNNELIENNYGIELIGYDCTVCGNTMRDNDEYGMYMLGKYNQIYNNTIKDNIGYGMKLENCTDNVIYQNDFINNLVQNGAQAIDDTGLSHWNSTVPDLVYTHSGTGGGDADVGYIGNYWSHMTCTDGDNDGICTEDCPINDYGGTLITNDDNPLKYLWSTYSLKCGDVDASGLVVMGDYTQLKQFVGGSGSVASMWASDVDCSCLVVMGDYTQLKQFVGGSGSLNCCKGCKKCIYP